VLLGPFIFPSELRAFRFSIRLSNAHRNVRSLGLTNVLKFNACARARARGEVTVKRIDHIATRYSFRKIADYSLTGLPDERRLDVWNAASERDSYTSERRNDATPVSGNGRRKMNE